MLVLLTAEKTSLETQVPEKWHVSIEMQGSHLYMPINRMTF